MYSLSSTEKSLKKRGQDKIVYIMFGLFAFSIEKYLTNIKVYKLELYNMILVHYMIVKRLSQLSKLTCIFMNL